jgi:hypothetical protein
MADDNKEDDVTGLKTITLLVSTHSHHGKVLAKGEKIELPPDVADWLINEKIGEYYG